MVPRNSRTLRPGVQKEKRNQQVEISARDYEKQFFIALIVFVSLGFSTHDSGYT